MHGIKFIWTLHKFQLKQGFEAYLDDTWLLAKLVK